MIERRGGKWVIISKTTGKVLGRFDTKAAAQKRERQIQFFKQREADTMDGKGTITLKLREGHVELLDLQEGTGSLARKTDDELRAIRQTLVDERLKISIEHSKMGDDRFSTPKGSALFSDIMYYNRVIDFVESEMAARYITL